MIDDRDRFPETAAHDLALDCLAAGIRAARPDRVVPDRLVLEGSRLLIDGAETVDLAAFDRVLVLGGGNAASQVARELERLLGDRVDGGVVVTDDAVDCERVRVLPGDHPTPSERGVESAREVLSAAASADADTLVLGVITGGGSALMPAPAEGVAGVAGVTLADLRETTASLLASGAAIGEINAVRKHLSDLKGGRLAAAAAPATVRCLVLSDVVGDDLSTIASGPFVPDETTFSDALSVLDRYDLSVPNAVRERLERGAAGEISETPSAGDPAFDRVRTHVLANGLTAMRAAAGVAREAGHEPLLVSSRIRGESRDAAVTAAAMAEEALATGNPVAPPAVFLSGGETTVTVEGDGTGGPNQEFALAAALELDVEPVDRDRVVVGAVDTDGVDGATDAAGAVLGPDAVADAERRAAGRAALADNDAYPVLDAVGALIETGPTGTNVNDLRVVVVTEAGAAGADRSRK
ncbi:glycerate kinase [Haloparvum alkalitolerans]|uniref:glycerate kinase type-2 family protein n=1 Tax=Haloparvum alkalitolerans TaxID=1042953 RepID=UPI003CF7A687